MLSYSYGVQVDKERLNQYKSVSRLSKPGGIQIHLLDPNYSIRSPYLKIEDIWNVTIDIELRKECFDYGGKNMEENMRPPLTYNLTPGVCLPIIVKLLCLDHVADTTSDQRYAFGQHPLEFGIDNCATHNICSEKSLFVGKIQQCSNIGVREVAGSVFI